MKRAAKRAAKRAGPHNLNGRLDADVLWTIFSFNTSLDKNFTVGDDEYDIPDDRALIDARHTSQVCRLWRSVMLSSPDIWGNSINFKYLKQKNGKWRNEVIRRTGRASLSIIALNLSKNFIGKRLLFSLFEKEAGRIRRLHTSTIGSFQNTSDDCAWTRLFLQEAPNLELLSFRQYSSINRSLSQVCLFQNKPTKLHTLILRGFVVCLRGPWTNTIRRLEIFHGGVVGSFASALSSMPKLETVHIDGCDIMEDSGNNTTPFTLPNIRHFYFKNNLETAAAILDLMPHTEGHVSNIIINGGNDSSLSTELMDRLHSALYQHIKMSFTKEMHLDISSYRMILTNRLSLPSMVPTFPSLLCIDMMGSVCLILNILSDGHLTSMITHLDLNLEENRFFGYRPALLTSIANLLASLHVVEVLHTTINSIPALTQRLHPASSPYLTRLHTLVLKPHHQPVSIELVGFIKKRCEVGYPLRRIKIKGFVTVHRKVVEYLGNSGMEVESTVPLGGNRIYRRA